MAKVTSEQVIAAAKTDPYFLSLSEEHQQMLLTYIEKIPVVLYAFFDTSLTFTDLMQALRTFLRYAFMRGFVRDTLRVMPESMFVGSSREEKKVFLERYYSGALARVEQMCNPEFATTYMQNSGKTEYDMLFLAGLNEAALKRYLEGNMTIGELMVLNPVAFLQQTPPSKES